MKKLCLSLALGVVAGLIDIIPMLIQKLDRYSILSAFVHWVVVGLIITYVQFGVRGWLKGLILAELLALPIVILVLKNESNAVLPILVMSALLGSLLGFVSEKYATTIV